MPVQLAQLLPGPEVARATRGRADWSQLQGAGRDRRRAGVGVDDRRTEGQIPPTHSMVSEPLPLIDWLKVADAAGSSIVTLALLLSDDVGGQAGRRALQRAAVDVGRAAVGVDAAEHQRAAARLRQAGGRALSAIVGVDGKRLRAVLDDDQVAAGRALQRAAGDVAAGRVDRGGDQDAAGGQGIAGRD